jgi:hypothetical protein
MAAMGYAREYHVERYFREIQIARIAPVSPQLILSHIAERCWACRSLLLKAGSRAGKTRQLLLITAAAERGPPLMRPVARSDLQ